MIVATVFIIVSVIVATVFIIVSTIVATVFIIISMIVATVFIIVSMIAVSAYNLKQKSDSYFSTIFFEVEAVRFSRLWRLIERWLIRVS